MVRWNKAGTHKKELGENGYRVLRGEALKMLKKHVELHYVTDINVVTTVFVNIKNRMICINTADIVTRRYRIVEVDE